MRAVSLVLVGLLVMAGLIAWAATSPSPAATPAVQGCPACHGAAGKQPTLDAVAKKIAGHPATAAKTITQCMVCHSKGPVPRPFRQVMHRIHLNSTTFASPAYKGTCTSCHQVDKATGTVTVYGLQK